MEIGVQFQEEMWAKGADLPLPDEMTRAVFEARVTSTRSRTSKSLLAVI